MENFYRGSRQTLLDAENGWFPVHEANLPLLDIAGRAVPVAILRMGAVLHDRSARCSYAAIQGFSPARQRIYFRFVLRGDLGDTQ
jgi:hypothetical protein